MQRKEQEGVHWLEFDLLANCSRISHGVFLRHGGHSQGDFGSLNLSDFQGDNRKHVELNRQKVGNILGVSTVISTDLCHGKSVYEVSENDFPEILPQADILATMRTGVGLLVTHADCQAAIIYDPVRHAVVNVHSGWRGNVQNVYAEAIEFMKCKYHSNPANLLACISPSLGPNDAQFVNYRNELPEAFWKYQVKPHYFNLWEISRMQLQQSGVLPHHIEIASISNHAHPEDYFSYRRLKVSGRNGTVVALM